MSEVLRQQLESAALHPSFPENQPDAAWESEIEASKAISLKRIADALTQPSNDFGESALQAISGQIRRSQAGDDR